VRKYLIYLIVSLSVCIALGVWAWRQVDAVGDRTLALDGQARLWIAPGNSAGAVGARLDALRLIERDWRWRWWKRLNAPLVQAGEYRIESGEKVTDLFRKLARGEIVQHRFTIIEGWTVARLLAEMARDPRLRSTLDRPDLPALMAELGCAGCFAEGWFLPETYQFVRGDRDRDLLARAHRAMREVLQSAWNGRADALPLDNPEQLLVLASLVEMEATVAAERARVAGVFVRRLRRGMRLQTDPTVVYGIEGEFDGRIRRKHLRADHPWNTYTRSGLPPTPIALPGAPAIQAAAHPAEGEALYFVARGDGTHHFSATLEEHNRAVARYILGRQ